MPIETSPKHFAPLLVLVPHRDARLPLRKWSGSLFAAGLSGAWSFPWVAPIASLSRIPSPGEMKNFATALAGNTEKTDVRFRTGQPDSALLPFAVNGKNAFVFGPSLENAFGGFAIENLLENMPLLQRVAKTVLGSAIIYTDVPERLPQPPQLSFRAAAIAVMHFRPMQFGALGESVLRHNSESGIYSFEWEIGRLYWISHVGHSAKQ